MKHLIYFLLITFFILLGCSAHPNGKAPYDGLIVKDGKGTYYIIRFSDYCFTQSKYYVEELKDNEFLKDRIK